MKTPIKIGSSACLLGHKVRYNGEHKRDPYVTETLGAYFDFVPVCPETECGLGVPRESMRLEGDPAAPRLVTGKTKIDHTERMLAFSRKRVEELANEDLCGFIFKSRSPSSGMTRIKVYDAKGIPKNAGTGLFAKAFMDRFPLIPVEDEGRLHDPGLRENFIERIFTLARWRALDAARTGTASRDAGALIDFHARHKLLLMSHSPETAREMGRLVAAGKTMPTDALYGAYLVLLMRAMALQATKPKHSNVLQHIQGYFKKSLTSDEKAECSEVIEAFRTGLTPLIVPVTLLNHYVRKYGEPYLAGQRYLHPHPLELRLRNHA